MKTKDAVPTRGSYTLISTLFSLAAFSTPYGKQSWTFCKTRKPFTCARTGNEYPAGAYAWRPTGNPRNRHERIAVDGLQNRRPSTPRGK